MQMERHLSYYFFSVNKICFDWLTQHSIPFHLAVRRIEIMTYNYQYLTIANGILDLKKGYDKTLKNTPIL